MTGHSAHTELPWEVRKISNAFADVVEVQRVGERHKVAIVERELGFNDDVDAESLANAAFIVCACNSHYELLEALKECRTDLLITANNAEDAAKKDTKWVGVGSALRWRIEQVDAAIAKAEART